MGFFKEHATEEQKELFNKYINEHTKFGPFESSVTKKLVRDEVNTFCKFTETEPQTFLILDFPMHYKVENCEMIKIDGVDHYNLTLQAYYTEPVVESFTPKSQEISITVDATIKDKYFGDCKNVILSSTVQGVVGPATQYYQLNYTEAVPNIFKDTLEIHNKDELLSLYLECIIHNCKNLYTGRFYIQ